MNEKRVLKYTTITIVFIIATNIQSQYDKEGYRTVLRPAESTEGIAIDGRLSTSMSIIGDSDYVSLDVSII